MFWGSLALFWKRLWQIRVRKKKFMADKYIPTHDYYRLHVIPLSLSSELSDNSYDFLTIEPISGQLLLSGHLQFLWGWPLGVRLYTIYVTINFNLKFFKELTSLILPWRLQTILCSSTLFFFALVVTSFLDLK